MAQRWPRHETGATDAWDEWIQRWNEAAKENPNWIIVKSHPQSGDSPYCVLCNSWADNVSHLLSQKCVRKQAYWGLTPGPVLQALIREFAMPMLAPGAVPVAQGPQTEHCDEWIQRWRKAAQENPNWIIIKWAKDSGYAPFCILCDQWADNVSHLLSKKCSRKQATWGLTPGPVLKALIREAEIPTSALGAVPAAQGSASPADAAEAPPPPPPPCYAPPWQSDQRNTVDNPHAVDTATLAACSNPYCEYLQHPSSEYEGYCCQACKQWHDNNYRKKTHHGKRCLRLLRGAGIIPVEAPVMPVCALTVIALTDVPLTLSADLMSSTSRTVLREQRLEMKEGLVCFFDEGSRLFVLRAAVHPHGWVTLAHRDERGSINGLFVEPRSGWHACFRDAAQLEQHWAEVDKNWLELHHFYGEFLRAREGVRKVQAAQMEDSLKHREYFRGLAAEAAGKYLRSTQNVREQCYGWQGGSMRKEAWDKAQSTLSWLEEGSTARIESELGQLQIRKQELLDARKEKRRRQADYEDAIDAGSGFEALKAQAQEAGQKVLQYEQLFKDQLLRAQRLIHEHAPEFLSQIEKEILWARSIGLHHEG